MDAPTTTAPTTTPANKVTQPTPQALPSRTNASSRSILVSPRQKGNPILQHIRSTPWEYIDATSPSSTSTTTTTTAAAAAADFLLNPSTSALFLSLKYHRLHPEYIYTRIRALGGSTTFRLRLLLVMVDIPNHEAALKELCKTALIYQLTLMLCWSAAEAGRYLELYHAAAAGANGGSANGTPSAAATALLRGHRSQAYSDRLVEFATVPRGVNRADAVALVGGFGSVRTACKAGPEELALLPGWGATKVRRWREAVREPFRVRRARARGRVEAEAEGPRRVDPDVAVRLGIGPELAVGDASASAPAAAAAAVGAVGEVDAERRAGTRVAEDAAEATETRWEPGEDEEEALRAMMEDEEGGGSSRR